MKVTVAQLLPALDLGGVQRGSVEVAEALVRHGHCSLVISAGGRLLPRLQASGSEHIPWSIGHKRPGVLRYVRRLRRLFAERQVDIIHARSRLPAWLGFLAWRGMDKARRPWFITTVHGPYTVNGYSAVMARGERVIVISEFIRDYVLSNYPRVAAEHVELIPRGISSREFPYGFRPGDEWLADWRRQHPAAGGRLLLTLPARITRWKGQQDFLALLAHLKQSGVAVYGVLLGGSDPRKAAFESTLRALSRRLGLQDDVAFLGARADVREILAISDFACSLTREPEAFGRTTVEALSLGTPVVGYDHGGTGEILRRVYPQGLCPVGDVQGAAARVLALHGHPVPVPRDQPYTLEAMLDRTLDLYEGLHGQRCSSAAGL